LIIKINNDTVVKTTMDVMLMAKHCRQWNQRVYERYMSEGRGQGEGREYKPWIRIQDFASLGIVSRIYSHKTERIHHLLSNHELYYFYLLEWSEKVIDIREQFPLSDVGAAVRIAANAGIAYPTDRLSGFSYVMTCDFMLTTKDGLKARTIKQASELSNPRVIEKLEIERRYWNKTGIDWKLVTDKEIDISKARAIEWVRQGCNGFQCTDPALRAEAAKRFENTNSPLSVAISIDCDFCLPAGSGMSIFKQLLQTRQIMPHLSCTVGAVNLGVLRTV
jgi:hypothetical protein